MFNFPIFRYTFSSPNFYLGIVGSNTWQIIKIYQVILQSDRSSLDAIL